MKRLWIWIVKRFGWQYDIPDLRERSELHHCVMICAPHTSALDFMLGASCIWAMGLNGKFFIKKEFFVFPIKGFLKRYGAVSIDRGNRKNDMVSMAVGELERNSEYTLIITPEGTRKKVKKWKRGFYEIAMKANVPIVVTYIDYKTRHMGVGPSVRPMGDFESDMLTILEVYREVGARHAEGWDLQKTQQYYQQELSKRQETK